MAPEQKEPFIKELGAIKEKQIEDLVQQILTNKNLTPAQKEQFIKELGAIKDQVDFTKPIQLFIPTTQEIKLGLAEIDPQEVQASAVSGYMVALASTELMRTDEEGNIQITADSDEMRHSDNLQL